MGSTPPKPTNDLLGESWSELSSSASIVGLKSPERVTPLPFLNSENLRLLREAQRESNPSSRVVSLASSRRDTPRGSPKSPPNSPNSEMCTDDELNNVYINYWHKSDETENDTDWLHEWNSRPDQQPPKDWKFAHPCNNQQKKKSAGYSVRLTRVGKMSLFSREILYSLILSNVLSLLLGTGLGIWLSKRGIMLTRVVLD